MDGRFPARPQGASQIAQYGVAALGKGITIACGLRLALSDLGGSAFINPMLTEY